MQKRKSLELNEINPPFKIRLTSFFKIYMLAGFGLFASMTIYLYLRFGMSNVLFILFICDAYFFYVGICYMRGIILVNEESIVFFRSRNIFAAPRRIGFKDIRSVKAELKPSVFNGWTLYFYLFIFENDKREPFKTLINGFSKADQVALIRLIARKAPSAEFDETVENLKNGISKYPYYPL